jgi:hypothetical protein|tara:strand:+ start:42 stop:311 length:270 start_codon:yes stop_codon:yes gene_type:complete
MKAELSVVEQSQDLLEVQEKSMGIHFQEFLESKGVDIAEFDNWSQRSLISLDGVILAGKGGFPAKVKEVLGMVVKPEQNLQFFPAQAGG